ncbi:hypothetical protein V2W45_1459700 [Cenococcum geophilum]
MNYLVIDACTLAPAIMEYHVILVNNSIALDPAHTYGDDKFIMVTLAFVNTIQSPTTYGGLWLDRSVTTGLPAFEYANSTDTLETPDYSINWSSPTDDMLATAREMLFRTVLLAANSSTAQALQTGHLTVFKSHYGPFW